MGPLSGYSWDLREKRGSGLTNEVNVPSRTRGVFKTRMAQWSIVLKVPVQLQPDAVAPARDRPGALDEQVTFEGRSVRCRDQAIQSVTSAV